MRLILGWMLVILIGMIYGYFLGDPYIPSVILGSIAGAIAIVLNKKEESK